MAASRWLPLSLLAASRRLQVVESVDSVAVVVESVDPVAVDSVNASVAIDSVTMDSVAMASVALVAMASVALGSLNASKALDSVAMDSVAMDSVAMDSVAMETIPAWEGNIPNAANGSNDHVHSSVRLSEHKHHCPTSGCGYPTGC